MSLPNAANAATVTVATALEEAEAFAQTGDLSAALARYRDILAADAEHPLALHGAGRVTMQAGDIATAARLLQRALASAEALPTQNKPLIAMLAADLGNAEYAAGRVDSAVIVWDRSIALDPDPAVEQWRTEALQMLEQIGNATHEVDATGRASALGMLATIATARDELAAAAEHLVQAAKLEPTERNWVRALAAVLRKTGDLEAIVRAYRRYLKAAPDDTATRVDLGRVLHETNLPKEAINEYRQALRADPANAEALLQLGIVLQEIGGKRDEIAPLIDAALARIDTLAPAARNGARRALGNTLNELCLYERAAEQFQIVLQTEPNDSVAKVGYGFSLDARNLYGPASVMYMETLKIDPLQERATIRNSHLLSKQGAWEASLYTLLNFLQYRPDHALARVHGALTIPLIYDDHAQIETMRARLDQEIDKLVAAPPKLSSEEVLQCFTNFELAYQGKNDIDLQRKTAAFYRQAFPGLAYTAAHVDKKTTRKRLRVGVVSAFLNFHTIGKLTRGYLEHLPREAFELVLVRPAYARTDDWSQRLDGHADGHVTLPNDLLASQRLMASLEFDVLFYPDIGMNNTTYFLAHSRLARLQTVTWGHPVTTGLTTIDSFISSVRMEGPAAQAHYSERLELFKDLPACYARPDDSAAADRIGLGFAPSARIYGCPQSLFKFHPDFDAVLAGILRADKRAVILVIEGHHSTWGKLIRARLERSMFDVHHRVKFIPHVDNDKFLGLLKATDVLLDPLHFGGGNTSFEALAAGVPIVTMPGEFMRSRVTVGAYDQMGFTDLVASDVKSYVDTAVRVANDRDYRAHCVAAINDGTTKLFDNRAAVTEFATYLTAAYHAI